MKSYLIHLIRHGITDGNLKGMYIGSTDMPLAPEGVSQLLSFREKFNYPVADAYFSSPLLRCTSTLKILYPEANPILIPGICECNFGDWEGKTAKELEHNAVFVDWIASGGIKAPPNGESGEQFMGRCCLAFEKILEGLMKSGTTSAVIVAHGGVIMSILSAFGLPRANFYDWMVGNGRGYSLRVTPSLWMRNKVAEVIDTLPAGDTPAMEGDQKYIIDIAREAADRAFGAVQEL